MENGQRKKKYPMSGRSLDDNTGVNYEQEAEAIHRLSKSGQKLGKDLL